jgi:hypothetical protein
VYIIHISPTVHLVCVDPRRRRTPVAGEYKKKKKMKIKIIIIMTTIIIKNRKLTFLLTRGVLTPTCSRIAYER